MNQHNRIVPPTLSIAAVERDTGLSKDTLRVWERRYGFPMPRRDAIGERAYSIDQVEKLRVVKRLMEAGHRPGRIVPLAFAELQSLSDSSIEPATATALLGQAELSSHLELIRKHDIPALRRGLTRLLSRHGVQRFITEALAPLNTAVGDAWIRGQMEIFEEHAYTETVQVVLRQAIANIPEATGPGAPRVLLTTLPNEPHGLGLLMAQAILALEGCHCVALGVQTPVWDIVLAVEAYRADIVALGFTGCINPNQIVLSLQELRDKLPPATAVWAGGSAPVLQRRRVRGVDVIASLDGVAAELRRWRH